MAEQFQTFDTVEIRFSGKESYLNEISYFNDIKTIRGFALYYVIDVESDTFDSFFLCISNTRAHLKLMNIKSVLTCRMVLFEKTDKLMNGAFVDF
jgi:hypothetical protein